MYADIDLIIQMSHNFYELLGISKQASENEIQSAFKLLTTKESVDEKDLENAKIALEILVDPSKRSMYDTWLKNSADHGIGFLNTNHKGIVDDIQSSMRIEELKSQQKVLKSQVLISYSSLFIGFVLTAISIANSFQILVSISCWMTSFILLAVGVAKLIRARKYRAEFNAMLHSLRIGE